MFNAKYAFGSLIGHDAKAKLTPNGRTANSELKRLTFEYILKFFSNLLTPALC